MTQPREEKKYYTIGELSGMTGVPEYSIRYWEREFHLLNPVRKESGHRRYTAKDVEALAEIKDLVYRRKMTLAGAKKFLSRRAPHKTSGAQGVASSDAETLRLLEEINKELFAILKEC
jgi:DNA-binding transcriptional MerR regulator